MSAMLGDRVREVQLVSRQRWWLAGTAMVAAIGASVAASISDGGQGGTVVVLVAALAIASLVRPDTHVALVVAVIVIAQCVANSDPVSPWMIAVACGLLVFHTLIALMAITPHNAVVGRAVILRWSIRLLAAVAAPVMMWSLLKLLTQRDATGSVTLTLLGFAILSALIVAVRAAAERSAA